MISYIYNKVHLTTFLLHYISTGVVKMERVQFQQEQVCPVIDYSPFELLTRIKIHRCSQN